MIFTFRRVGRGFLVRSCVVSGSASIGWILEESFLVVGFDCVFGEGFGWFECFSGGLGVFRLGCSIYNFWILRSVFL